MEFDQFNHVDFLYSRDIFNMVYKSVMNTVLTADTIDWKPVYDRTTPFYAQSNYSQCNDAELRERNSRKNNNGFWNTITSFIKKKEIQPLIPNKEENGEISKSKNMFKRAWKEIIYV